MKKILALLVLALVIGFGVLSLTPIAYADEYPETETEETAEETKDLTAQVADLIAKVNEIKEEDYFAKNILPSILAIGSTVLGGLVLLFPKLKTLKEYKTLQGAYAGLKKGYDDLETLLTNTNPEKIQAALSNLISGEVAEQFDKLKTSLKIDDKQIAELKANVGEISAQLAAFMSAAMVTWSPNKQAVALLNTPVTGEQLIAAQEKALKLENLIRALKGEEADEILKQIEV